MQIVSYEMSEPFFWEKQEKKVKCQCRLLIADKAQTISGYLNISGYFFKK